MKFTLLFAALLAPLTLMAAIDPSEAASIHDRILTLDTHLDTPIVLDRPTFDITERHDPWDDDSQVDLPRMIEGGLDAGFFAVWVAQGPRTPTARNKAKAKARALFESIHSMIEENSDDFELALVADDAERIVGQGKRAIYIGIENGDVIGKDLDLLQEYYDRGARYITLSHTKNNEICDSSTDKPEHGGVSDFGKLVIEEMNRLGIMVDISHISDAAALQAIELSKAPVIASHSSAYAVYPHPRNANDEILRKLAETGGVLQMNMYGGYLKDVKNSPERVEALREWRKKYGRDIDDLSPEKQIEARNARGEIDRNTPPDLASLEDVMEHIDHVAKLIGVDHLGIGADFDGGGGVLNCYDVSEFPNVTLALLERGYSEEDIAKIWSGNLFRVMRENERIAKELQEEEKASS